VYDQGQIRREKWGEEGRRDSRFDGGFHVTTVELPTRLFDPGRTYRRKIKGATKERVIMTHDVVGRKG